MPSPTQSDPVEALPTVLPADLKNDRYPNGRSSVGRRALTALVRFLTIFCIGVSATLAWQSYGEVVREMVASSYPQLSWLAPQAEPVPQNAPDVIGLASRTVPQPNAMSVDLDAVRQNIDRIATSIASSQEQMTGSADRIATSQQQIAGSVDRIAASQEQMMRGVDQMMRSVDQFTADQEQMTREITKLQEIEQSIHARNSEESRRTVSASAPKPASRPASASKPAARPASAPNPVPRPASAPAAKPLSRASQEPTAP
jgi:hypothetical protein